MPHNESDFPPLPPLKGQGGHYTAEGMREYVMADRKSRGEPEMMLQEEQTECGKDVGGNVPKADFDDPRVQRVYSIICGDNHPPSDEHWDGYVSKLIVDALFGAEPVRGTPVRERIARLEQEPKRKAALDRARDRIRGLMAQLEHESMRDDEISQLINSIRDAAIEFKDTQQLRERIAQLVLPLVKHTTKPTESAKVPSNAEIIECGHRMAWRYRMGTDGYANQYTFNDRTLIDFVQRMLRCYGAPAEREGWQFVPKEPSDDQWGNLARDIIMAWDFDQKRPGELLKFLERSGVLIPQWLRDEPEMKNLEHMPSKGTRATLIYKAMLHDAPGFESGKDQ